MIIKKIIKFSFSWLLILCICYNSFAANSSSSPAAFVTKAEFDNALSDFNTRLSIFEAGINSKIDLQVTSYLDRNGIWSALEQTLSSSIGKSNTVWLNPFKNAVTTESVAHAFVQAASTTNSMTTVNINVNSMTISQKNEDMIEFCPLVTKSGLCYIDYTYAATYNMYYYASYVLADNNTTENVANFWNGVGTGYALYRFRTDYINASDANKKNIKLINYTTTETNPSYDGMGIYAISPNAAQNFGMTGYLQMYETDKNTSVDVMKTSDLVYINVTSKKYYPICYQNSSSEPYYNNVYNFGGTIEPVNSNVTFFVTKGNKLKVKVQMICSGRGWDTFQVARTSYSDRKPAWVWGIQFNEVSVY